MARTPKYRYEPTTTEAVAALIAYHDQAVTYLSDPAAPEPDPILLTQGLPQGSISKIEVVDGETGPQVEVTIKDRPPRTMTVEGAFMLRVLAIFEGGAIFFDKSSTNPAERKDYLEAFGELGVTVQRLWADAQAGEQVRLRKGCHHHDLRPEALMIVRGSPKIVRGRREVREEALVAYDKNVTASGLADALPRHAYSVMLRTAFKLFDIKHGHHFLRRIAKD